MENKKCKNVNCVTTLFLIVKSAFALLRLYLYPPLDVGLKLESSTEYDDDDPVLLVLPTKDELQVLLDRIEHQLPRDDHVKYDSR